MQNPLSPHPVLQKVLVGAAAFMALVILVVFFFPWDALRGPINRYVSGQLGRRFEITQHLAVHLQPYPWGRTTVRAEGIEFANPEWAREPYLVKAEAAEFEIKLWPLLSGKVYLPRVSLVKPMIGLQIEPDGRRTWAFAKDTSSERAMPTIGALLVDQGVLKYSAKAQGADITAQFALAPEAAVTVTPAQSVVSGTSVRSGNPSPGGTPAAVDLPLTYQATGQWKNEPFKASGRTGGILHLSQDINEPFPLEINVVAGKTMLKAKGSIENLQELSGLDASFDMRGNNLEELFKLLGVGLPSTPPYKLSGKLQKRGDVWSARQLNGLLGGSDLEGELSYDTSGGTPLLTGKLQSKVLDFIDLRPVIGLPVATKPAAIAVAGKTGAVRPAKGLAGKVLPTATLDVARLNAMNADVTYSAADIRHAEALPLDKGSVHVKLTSGVLQLSPISLGVAGGTLAGRITIDTKTAPASVETKLNMTAVQLNKLFPTIEKTKSSLGKISGQINLKGRGNSAAAMLGSASGDVAALMGKGEISNLLLEFIGLDGGEVIKFLLRGDRNVQLRCAAAAFEVKQGLMSSKTIVLDTTDTVIDGDGSISLANETLDITLHPQPKDVSILSLRSPLKISGSFAAPSAGPDKAALAGRAGLAVALGLINPLLALAATVETGPGQDADCRQVLALAANPKAKAPPQDAKPAATAAPAVATPPAKPVSKAAAPNDLYTRP